LAFISTLAIVILLLNQKLITLLYGIEYVEASQAVPYLLPGMILMSLYIVIGKSYVANDKQKVTIIAGVLGLIVNITANIILIPRMGIKGAALATTLSYSLTGSIVLINFLKESGIGLRRIILVNREDIRMYRSKLRQLLAMQRTS
jgi:O-antigen/teichoic acid export membrane protein